MTSESCSLHGVVRFVSKSQTHPPLILLSCVIPQPLFKLTSRLDTCNNTLRSVGVPPANLSVPLNVSFPQCGIVSTSDITSVCFVENGGPLNITALNGPLYQVNTDSGTQIIEPVLGNNNPVENKAVCLASAHGRRTSTAYTILRGSQMTTNILMFPTYFDLKSHYTSTGARNLSIEQVVGSPKSMVAGATNLALLTNQGAVYTWGDSRYSNCLGRDGDAENPAIVEELLGVRISKIDASGWVFGALSAYHDRIYLWGDGPPGYERSNTLTEFLAGREGAQLEGKRMTFLEWVGEHIKDFGIGNGFMVVLTEAGGLWVTGENQNGQLGLGTIADDVKTWTRVDGAQFAHANITGVTVGPLSTFLIISK